MGRRGTTDVRQVRLPDNKKRVTLGVQRLIRLAFVAGLGVFLWHYFSGLDLSLALRRISESGFLLLFVLLPYGLIILAESIAWRLTIRRKPGPEPER